MKMPLSLKEDAKVEADARRENNHFLIVHPRGTCKICDHIRLLLEFDYALLKWHNNRLEAGNE